VPSQSLPPIKIWKDRNPLGYARLTHARAALIELSTQIQIPTENLVTPELVRKICWQDPPALSSEYEDFVIEQLNKTGARPWQIELVTPPISAALSQTEPLIIPEPVEAEGEPETAL
jgi:ribonuclease D